MKLKLEPKIKKVPRAYRFDADLVRRIENAAHRRKSSISRLVEAVLTAFCDEDELERKRRKAG
jgi:hypothetical protein